MLHQSLPRFLKCPGYSLAGTTLTCQDILSIAFKLKKQTWDIFQGLNSRQTRCSIWQQSQTLMSRRVQSLAGHVGSCADWIGCGALYTTCFQRFSGPSKIFVLSKVWMRPPCSKILDTRPKQLNFLQNTTLADWERWDEWFNENVTQCRPIISIIFPAKRWF